MDRKGFTLIELLIVIAIIGFLMAAILVAVDPVKRIRQSRNAQRWSETNAILNAILKKQVDERIQYDGEGTAGIITHPDYVQVIVRDDTGVICNQWANRPGCDQPMDISGANKNCVANLNGEDESGIVPAYIAELPLDPLDIGQNGCGSGSGCEVEGGMAISEDGNTGYYIRRTADGRIEVGACHPELDETIRVKR
ncbi:prepilin-type N-terminal cleavage/methylation domain-containing protein [Candidatus Uhrbacteria bacterium]|nr:prepilin-type N-terminal cleavage/methylation domain-containing protein [Candidatus Uhrbacteria bacterium]